LTSPPLDAPPVAAHDRRACAITRSTPPLADAIGGTPVTVGTVKRRSGGGAQHQVTEPDSWASGIPAVATSVTRTLSAMGVTRSLRTLAVINQPEGFDCPGCAWPEAEPGSRHAIEFCENGAKAVAEEATTTRATPEFFATHSVASLRTRSDYWLGEAGRLTHPMIKRPGDTHYRPLAWADAFAEIAAQLRGLDGPDEAVFYTSGRTSNEAAFMYQLLVRSFGTNNLPDCSNMCHEATSLALGQNIGIGKGSVHLADFALADVILIVGQNPGTNHPRMLSTLEEAKRNGASIIAINPLPEAGLRRFKNPQKIRGIVGRGTELSDLHLPVALGGDQALFQLLNRRLIDREAVRPGTIDRDFIERYTSGFDEMAGHLAGVDAAALLNRTGLDAGDVDTAFEMIAGAERLIICWAMGITQHVNAVDTIGEITNLALLGGHIGRPGAGLCPVRGHSNVQGDRTMGIFEKPSTHLLDALEAEFDIPMPRDDGFDAVQTVKAFADGRAKVMMCLGGNFARAISDTDVAEAALQRAQLTVQVSTKLNRSHLMCGDTGIILPALGRTEVDRSSCGVQFVSVEDSMSLVHKSTGVLPPASSELHSEVSIVCDLGVALFGNEHPVCWATLRDDNDAVRDHIAAVIPGFESFNERVRVPGGFGLPHPPRDERRFDTDDGRAHFTATTVAPADHPASQLTLQTLRSHDQYNTTIYGHDDRYRGISGDRHVIMVNPDDVTRLGFADGDIVDIISVFPDRERRADHYRIVCYPTPLGSAAAYYPETNVLVALDHHARGANTPASKSIPIRLERRGQPTAATA
jgi:formate dehydrogenase major subunit